MAIKVAHLYGVDSLLDRACATVVKLTTTATAVAARAFANQHLPFSAGRTISSAAAKVVGGHFEEVGEGLVGLADPCMDFLLRSNDLVVASEDSVLSAIIKRVNQSSTLQELRVCTGWQSHVRWGQLSKARTAALLEVLHAGTDDKSDLWVSAYQTGLLDALTTYVDDGMARLRPANVRRGGASAHTIEMAAALNVGDEQRSDPLVVAAGSWRLVIEARKGDAKSFDPHVLVTLRREATCPVAEAAGVRSADAVNVTGCIYVFSLTHGLTRNNRTAIRYTMPCAQTAMTPIRFIFSTMATVLQLWVRAGRRCCAGRPR